MKREKDLKKVKKILQVLSNNPEGLWIRQMSKESGIALSTVHYYINNILDELVENIGVKDARGRYFGVRIIRLKPKIREIVSSGDFEKVYKFLKMAHKL